MGEYYIEHYITNLLENTYNDDLERLKALYYGLESVANSLEYNLETDEDKHNYNKIVTCMITLKEIIDEEDKKQTIPF